MLILSRHSSLNYRTKSGLGSIGLTSYTSRPRARHRYCGKEKDKESGLYYYGARYYECWTCRFVSVDPLAEKFAQLSSYNYASNNPVTSLDIDGLQNPDQEPSKNESSSVNAPTIQNPIDKTAVKVTGVQTLEHRLQQYRKAHPEQSNDIRLNADFFSIDTENVLSNLCLSDKETKFLQLRPLKSTIEVSESEVGVADLSYWEALSDVAGPQIWDALSSVKVKFALLDHTVGFRWKTMGIGGNVIFGKQVNTTSSIDFSTSGFKANVPSPKYDVFSIGLGTFEYERKQEFRRSGFQAIGPVNHSAKVHYLKVSLPLSEDKDIYPQAGFSFVDITLGAYYGFSFSIAFEPK